jgi:folate-binding protein YgfZ
VRGPDAGTLLGGITTNDVARLSVGRLQPNLLCATKGRILHSVLVLRTKPEEYLVISEPGDGDGVAIHIDGYHVREEAQLGMVGLSRIDLIGPQAPDALRELDADPAQLANTFGAQPLLLSALPFGHIPRIVCLLPAGQAAAFVEALLATSAGPRLVGQAAVDELRTRAGIPRFGVDFDTTFLPAEAALYDHIAFGKGCYVGQEIHARMHYRGHPNRKLVAVRLPAAAAVAVGDALYADGEQVGTLTSVAGEADGDARGGIALIRFKTLQAGLPLALEPDGSPVVTLHATAGDLGHGHA